MLSTAKRFQGGFSLTDHAPDRKTIRSLQKLLQIAAGNLHKPPSAAFLHGMITPVRALLFLGVYLILAGIAGFASNPSGAKTALLSGGFFGSLCLVWAFLCHKGFRFAKIAAIATMCLLVAAFLWRATAGWLEVADGNDTKIFAASLITSMLLATAFALAFVIRGRNVASPGGKNSPDLPPGQRPAR